MCVNKYANANIIVASAPYGIKGCDVDGHIGRDNFPGPTDDPGGSGGGGISGGGGGDGLAVEFLAGSH